MIRPAKNLNKIERKNYISIFIFIYKKNLNKKYLKKKILMNQKSHLNHNFPLYKFFFSKNWPLADSFIESRCPCSVCVFVPFHAIFFEASHWPSDHMPRSRPLIGQPSFPTIWWWWGEGEGGRIFF